MNVQGNGRISENRETLNMNENRKETHDLCTVFHSPSILYPQTFEKYPQFKKIIHKCYTHLWIIPIQTPKTQNITSEKTTVYNALSGATYGHLSFLRC